MLSRLFKFTCNKREKIGTKLISELIDKEGWRDYREGYKNSHHLSHS